MKYLVIIETKNSEAPFSLLWQDATDDAWEALEPLLEDGSMQPGDKAYVCNAEHVREFTATAKTVAVETAEAPR